MSQHTPGPWSTSRDAVPDYHVQVTVYAESDGQRVATAFREQANAHLIAAAPDLLAALEEARGIIQQHNLLSDGPEHTRPDLNRDRIATLQRLFTWTNGPRLEAIAKAKGQ